MADDTPDFVVPADRPAPSNRAARLVSVLVPCCGQLEYTRLCLARLARHTRPPFEVIPVDVGSLDGTSDFLDGFAAAAPFRVDVVRAAAEHDFAAAVALAVARAEGEFVAWVANDALVTDAWADQLAALLGSGADLGLVGPMLNHAPAHQSVGPPGYALRFRPVASVYGPRPGEGPVADLSPVDRFAQQWRDRHRGEWFETTELAAACLMLPRALARDVGLASPADPPGVVDPAALCRSVRRAGFRVACCRDLFVHTFASRSPAAEAPDRPA